MIGRSLGHHTILAKLGSGGMGTVYRARDASLGREVALKVLPPEVARDRARLERFQREARAVAALKHPNIVTLYSVEEADGVHFFTMELVEGKGMGQLIPTGGITLDRFLDLAIPLADALRAAHERGITHRDLKPANIMVDTEGRVKVLDFGLAKLRAETSPPELSQLPTEALTQEGLVVGTVPYMSPEQVEGRAVDHRSDIFSLGIVLYEMVAGERPFRGDSSAALVSSILRDTPPLVTDLKAEHPAELGRIVRRCLEKDPSHRFQTALDVRNELEDLQKEVVIGKAVGARPRVAPEPAAGPAPVFRHRWPIPVVLAVLAAVVGIYWMTTRIPPRPAGAPQITSLAVLPLENLSGDAEQEYFADGLTEALITDLAKLGTLKVIARASVMPFKEASRPLPEIAQQLGVEGLITGAVLRSGGQIRITAQLIDAASQEHLWADRYEKELRDVLLIQSQIVEAIAGEIELALTPQEQHRLGRAPTIDPQAHDAYLRGRYFLNKGSPAGYKSAIDDFRRALEREPDYAPVHAGLAQAYLLLAFEGLPPVEVAAREESRTEARTAAARALELDDSLGEAHTSLGAIRLTFDWDWSEAEIELRRAIELNPSGASSHFWYSLMLSAVGRHEEAIEQARQAYELDPLSPIAGNWLGETLYFARQYDRAIEQHRRALEVNPSDVYALMALGNTLVMKGRLDEASALWAKGHELTGNDELATIYRESGFEDGMRRWLAQAKGPSPPAFAKLGVIAKVHAALGEKQEALDWLEKALEEHEFVWLKTEPRFDSLRSDPRFQDLLRRMNFPG